MATPTSASAASQQTEELLDVDNPLASGVSTGANGTTSGSAASAGSEQGTSNAPGFPVGAIVGIAAALIVAAGLIFFYLRRNKTK